MHNYTTPLVCAGALALIATPQVANGQDAAETGDGDGVMSDLYACRQIEDPQARLTCYDGTVAKLEQAVADEEVIITDREEVREAKRGLFGLKLPRIGLFTSREGQEAADEVREIEGTLASFGYSGYKKAYFTLSDGAQWVQTDSTQILGNPKAGDKVTIEQAAFGSYKASIEGRRWFRVRRVQ